MRRDINVRKRKQMLLRKINLKSLRLLVFLIVLLCICIFIYLFFIQDLFIKNNLEQDSLFFSSFNEDIPFSLSKIVLFSSATAETGSVNQQLSLNISQYCDIGIYLNNTKENVFIQSLSINDITLSNSELGTPCLYKKNIQDFGKCSYKKENLIENEFSFPIVDSSTTLNYENSK